MIPKFREGQMVRILTVPKQTIVRITRVHSYFDQFIGNVYVYDTTRGYCALREHDIKIFEETLNNDRMGERNG